MYVHVCSYMYVCMCLCNYVSKCVYVCAYDYVVLRVAMHVQHCMGKWSVRLLFDMHKFIRKES